MDVSALEEKVGKFSDLVAATFRNGKADIKAIGNLLEQIVEFVSAIETVDDEPMQVESLTSLMKDTHVLCQMTKAKNMCSSLDIFSDTFTGVLSCLSRIFNLVKLLGNKSEDSQVSTKQLGALIQLTHKNFLVIAELFEGHMFLLEEKMDFDPYHDVFECMVNATVELADIDSSGCVKIWNVFQNCFFAFEKQFIGNFDRYGVLFLKCSDVLHKALHQWQQAVEQRSGNADKLEKVAKSFISKINFYRDRFKKTMNKEGFLKMIDTLVLIRRYWMTYDLDLEVVANMMMVTHMKDCLCVRSGPEAIRDLLTNNHKSCFVEMPGCELKYEHINYVFIVNRLLEAIPKKRNDLDVFDRWMSLCPEGFNSNNAKSSGDEGINNHIENDNVINNSSNKDSGNNKINNHVTSTTSTLNKDSNSDSNVFNENNTRKDGGNNIENNSSSKSGTEINNRETRSMKSLHILELLINYMGEHCGEAFFTLCKKGLGELRSGSCKGNGTFYEETLVLLCNFVKWLPSEYFVHLEEILVKSILTTNPIKFHVAADMWCYITRIAPEDVRLCHFKFLGNLMRKYYGSRFEQNFGHLLGRLFQFLSPTQKVLHYIHNGITKKYVLSEFPISSQTVSMWCHLDLRSIQPGHHCSEFVEAVGNKLLALIDLKGEESAYTDRQIVDALRCLVNVTSDKKNLEFKLNLVKPVVDFWMCFSDIQEDIAMDESLLISMLQLLSNVFVHLDGHSIQTVLPIVKQVLITTESAAFLLQCCQFLSTLKSFVFPLKIQKSCLSEISEMFKFLLTRSFWLIDVHAMKALKEFAELTSYSKALSSFLPAWRKKDFTKFLKKQPNETKKSIDDVYSATFQHVISQSIQTKMSEQSEDEDGDEVPLKRAKIDEGEETEEQQNVCSESTVEKSEQDFDPQPDERLMDESIASIENQVKLFAENSRGILTQTQRTRISYIAQLLQGTIK